MPTILIQDGFRLFFYANEGSEPAHVHVQYQAGVVKFWITPVAVADNKGMSAKDLKNAFAIVKQNEQLIKEKWNEFFSAKK